MSRQRKQIIRKIAALGISAVMLVGSAFSPTAPIYLSGNITANAETYTFGDFEYSVKSDNTVEITKYKDSTNDTFVTIPSEINSYSVTSIGRYAFDGCTGLQSVNVPDSVISIGDGAFSNCSGLRNVNISNGVVNIGSYAFHKCIRIISIDVPESVSSIGMCAFAGCTLLANINIPENLTSVGEKILDKTAWYDNQPDGVVYAGNVLYSYKGTMTTGTSINIKDGIRFILAYAFKDCVNLTNISLPDSVISIGYDAFYGCTGLQSINIPDGVQKIAGNTFYQCKTLNNIKFPNSITQIDDYAFYGCSNLTSLNMQEGITSIGSYAFCGCSNLTRLNIPKSVTSIGSYAFCGCKNLTSIKIQGSADIFEGAFSSCRSLIDLTLSEGISYIGKYAFCSCEKLESVTIPGSVKSIADYAFFECKVLKDVTICDGVQSIGTSAFYQASNYVFMNITIPPSVTYLGPLCIEGDDYYHHPTIYGVGGSAAQTYAKEHNIRFVDTDIVLGIKFEKDNFYVQKGDFIKPNVIFDPQNATNRTLEWYSINPNIATVDENGEVHALSVGSAVIYIYTPNNLSAKCTVNVLEPANSVKLDKTYATIGVNDTLTLNAEISPSTSTDNVTWSSDNQSIAQVSSSNGKQAVIKALQTGTVNITATTDSGKTAYCKIIVKPHITNISFPESIYQIDKGEIFSLEPTITPADSIDTIKSYTSSNKNVATVDNYGNVTALSAGQTEISVTTSNGKNAKCIVNVLVPSSSIKLDKTYATIGVNDTLTLNAEVSPSDSTDKITWSSNDESIASISNTNGKQAVIKALKVGTIKITATTESGKSISCTVTVKAHASNVNFSQISYEIEKGEILSLDTTITPINSIDTVKSYVSADPDIAKVDNQGNVTALSAGQTSITATTSNGLSTSCNVKVVVSATGVTLDKTSATIGVNDTLTLNANIIPQDSTEQIKWSSDNENIVNITSITGNQIVIKAVKTGTANITVTTDSGKKAVCKVNVKPHAESVGFSQSVYEIEKGDTLSLTPTIKPADSVDTIKSYVSSNSDVAKIDGNGKVTALSAGQTSITATTSNGKIAKCTVKVNVAATSIKLSQNTATVEKGSVFTLIATMQPDDSNDNITWTSSVPTVATVAEGVVTGINVGTTVITATTHSGQKASCTVVVENATIEVTKITLNKTSLNLVKGNSETLTATVYPSDASNKTLTWKSSNSNVATVSNGKITAVAVGTATITATANNGQQATCKVTVENPTVDVTKVTLNKNSLNLVKGNSETLTATVYPSDASNKTLTWKSSNSNVATVSNGKITAVAVGTATITATANNGQKATCTVNITASGKFEWGRDNWRFTNSSVYFGNTYYINSNYYNKLLHGLNNTEKQRVIEGLSEAWGGSCYGMASLSILGSYNIIDPSVYTSGAHSINEISSPPSSDVKSLINYYYALQFTDQIYQKTLTAIYQSEEEKIKRLLKCLEDGSPTLFTYFWGEYNPISQRYDTHGHAIVAYDVKNVSGIINEFKYDKKVLTYDNRLTGLSDGKCIYINTQEYSWYLPDDNAYSYYSDSTDYFGIITDNLDDINYHGYINGNNKISVGDFIASLSTSSISPEIKWSSFSETGYGGGYNSVEDDEIKLFAPMTDDNNSNKLEVGFKNSKKGYSMKIGSNMPQEASMRYENNLIKVETSNTNRLSFAPSGFTAIEGNNTDYKFDVIYNEGYYYGDWYEISVNGSKVNNASLKPKSDGYILEATNLNDVKITFKNDALSSTKTFSTDYSRVFIYEIDENTVGLKVDTDNNGTYETDITDQNNLKNISAISSEAISLGSNVNVKSSATGGISPYQYAVYYKKSEASNWITAQNFGTNANSTITPSTIGTYSICVKVKDAKGTIAKQYFTLTVKDAEFLSKSSLSATSVNVGSSVIVKCSATGGTSPYQYAVLYQRPDSTNWGVLQNFSTNANVTIKPAMVGTYNICTKIKDSNGTIAKQYLKLTVKANDLASRSSLSATSVNIGTSVTVKCSATGGTSPYQYAVLYKKPNGSNWGIAQNFSTNANVAMKPITVGNYEICTKVKDFNGTVAKQYMTLTVKANNLASKSSLSTTSVNLGSSVTVKCSATGGTAPYQYAVLYQRPDSTNWGVLQNFSTNANVTIKPAMVGTYNICTKIKDSNGTIAKQYLKLTVKANALVSRSSLSATSVNVGSSVAVKCSATGGTAPYQYAIFYKKVESSNWNIAQNFGTNANVTIKPTTNGTYDICAKVKDSKGIIVKQYFKLVVK